MKKTKQPKMKDFYKESLQFIKESRKYIYLAGGIFLFFFLCGFFLQVPADTEKLLLDSIRQIAEKFVGLNAFETIWAIFFNNLNVSFLIILSGIFFGIIPLFMLLSNGFIVGFVAQKVVSAEGLLTLWKLLPHGIFEIPAVLISAGLGIKIGFEILSKKGSFRDNVRKSFLSFVLIVIPLLIIAAIIEGSLIFLLG